MKYFDLLKACREMKTVLATVESCTGGLVAATITDIPGSSEIFWGGWNTYDNSAKIALGVPTSLIQKHGAVSAEVAISMAEAGLKKMKAALKKSAARDIQLKNYQENLLVVSTSGIAGPGGGTAEKPVGLCYLAIAQSGQKPRSIQFVSPSGTLRSENRRLFAEQAVRAIHQALHDGSVDPSSSGLGTLR